MSDAAPLIQRRPLPPTPWHLDPLPPLLQRIYAGRGITTAAELTHRLKALLPPDALGGVDRAAAYLARARAEGWPVAVVADFDADGATACAVMVRGLRQLGFAAVHYFVPRREAGYGLSRALVDQALAVGARLLITVDNGISSVDAVQYAQAQGVDVLITDHHLPGPTLPPARVIVNPNLRGDNFPSKALCGVGVAFYVLMGLRKHLRELGVFTDDTQPPLGELLDLVALGTVADVVSLDHNNRILVAEGLKRLREGRGCAGIRALAQVAGKPLNQLTSLDLGFLIGPRLNAAGRLDDMRVGIDCLLGDDPEVAHQQASQLHQINATRRQRQGEMETQADAILAQWVDAPLAAGICLFDERWNQGLVGLLASRLKDQRQRPVLVFCRDSPTTLRASGRAPPGFHLRDALARLDHQLPGAMRHFGGHSAAAGLTLEEAAFAEFAAAFNALVAQQQPQGFRRVFLTDGPLAPTECTWATAKVLGEAGPWGKDFEPPLFDGWFTATVLKQLPKQTVKYRVDAPGYPPMTALSFRLPPLPTDAPVRLMYHFELNEWRGESEPQFRIEHWAKD